jgi:TonB family protein
MMNPFLIFLAVVAPAALPHPAGNPQSWVTDDDYPAAALRAGEQGRVGVRLEIDAAGVVTGCTVTSASGSALLDARTCELLSARARFEAAHDGAGKPIASSWRSTLSWRLPDQPASSRGGFAVTTYEVEPDGRIRSCRTVGEQGQPIDADPCQAAAKGNPPSWLRRYAATYHVLRFQVGYETRDAMPAAAGADWGMVVSRRLSVTGFSSQMAIVDCRVLASVGPPDAGPDSCSANRARMPAGSDIRPPAAFRLVDGWAIYGVKRERR